MDSFYNTFGKKTKMTITDKIIAELISFKTPVINISEAISIIKKYANDTEDIIVGDLIISINKNEININKKTSKLPRKVFQVLHFFVSNQEKIIYRSQLIEQIWGTDIIVGERTIDVHIRKIREKGINNIKTCKGVGYIWKNK